MFVLQLALLERIVYLGYRERTEKLCLRDNRVIPQGGAGKERVEFVPWSEVAKQMKYSQDENYLYRRDLFLLF